MDLGYWLQTGAGLAGVGLFWNFSPAFFPVISFMTAVFLCQDFSSPRARRFKFGLFVLAFISFQGIAGLIYAALGTPGVAFYQTPAIKVLWAALFALGGWLLWIKEIPLAVKKIAALGIDEDRKKSLRFLLLSGSVSLLFLPAAGKDYAVLVNYAASIKDIPAAFITFLFLALGFISFPAALLLSAFAYKEKILSNDLYLWSKRMAAFAHFLAGAYFMTQAFAWEHAKLKAAGIVLSALFAGTQSSLLQRQGSRWFIRSLAGLALLAGVAGLLQSQRQGVVWEEYSAAKLEQAKKQGIPVVMDFSATWCVPCHEMERYTFSDPQVMEKLRGYLKLKVDVTDPDNEATQSAAEVYEVVGIPTIVFLDRQGQEVKPSRIDGYAAAKEFLAAIPVEL